MPAESTLIQYQRVINTLTKRGVDDLQDTKKVLEVASTTIKGEVAKSSSISNILCAVMYFTKDTPVYETYKAEMVKYMKQKSDAHTGLPTAKSVDWKVLSNVYKEYEDQDRGILAMYSLAPPRRLHDYACMKVVGRKPVKIDGNYLVINKSGMKFYFGAYKTKDTYGIQVFSVPAALREELEPLAILNQPLFRTPSGTAYSDTSFSTKIGDLTHSKIGVRATANTFRHSFLSWFDATAPTPAKRKSVAEFMGHSVAMSLGYVEREEEE